MAKSEQTFRLKDAETINAAMFAAWECDCFVRPSKDNQAITIIGEHENVVRAAGLLRNDGAKAVAMYDAAFAAPVESVAEEIPATETVAPAAETIAPDRKTPEVQSDAPNPPAE